MKARLIHKEEKVRYYKLSEPIKTGIRFFGRFDIRKCVMSWIESTVKPEYLEQIASCFPEDGLTLLAVVDSSTHVERLVVPAFTFEGEIIPMNINIDGRPTLLCDGGNVRHVHPDEVYMRHLCMINGLKWEGFESEE